MRPGVVLLTAIIVLSCVHIAYSDSLGIDNKQCTQKTKFCVCQASQACINGQCGPCLVDSDCGIEVCIKGKCTHKNLLPNINWQDAVGTFCFMIGGALAAAGGIGGGGIFVPLLIILMGFEPHDAVPISSGLIFAGSISAFVWNSRRKHPFCERPLIDVKTVLYLEPATLAGTTIGIIANRVMAPIVLVIFVTVFLVIASVRTLRTGLKAWSAESDQRSRHAPLLKGHRANINGDVDVEGEGVGVDVESDSIVHTRGRSTRSIRDFSEFSEFGNVLDADAEEERDPISPEGEGIQAEAEVEMTTTEHEHENEHDDYGAGDTASGNAHILKSIMEAEKTFPVKSLLALVAVWIGFIVINVFKGNAFGMVFPCSPAYWILFACLFVFVGTVSVFMFRYLRRDHDLKETVGYMFQPGDIVWRASTALKYPIGFLVAGFIAGFAGIGGGMVIGPLLLDLGMNPLVAAATSYTFVLFTSSATTAQFLIIGALRFDYAIWFGLVCAVCVIIGQVVIQKLVKKYNRQSIIIFVVFGILVIATAMLAGRGISDIEAGVRCGNLPGMRNLCIV